MRDTTPVRGFSTRDQLRRYTRPSQETELRRALGVFSATLIVVGGIIGSGIFFTPSVVATALPTGAWVVAIWAFGGLVALAGALTFAELGAMMPDAGGTYVYVREAFGGLPAFLYGWMTLASIASGALAAVAMGFAGYLDRFVNLAAVGGALPVAVAALVALTITNYLGVRPGAFVNNALTVIKIFTLGALIVGGVVWWGRTGAPYPAVPGAPAPRASLLIGAAAAFVPVLFTFGGWQQMNMVAGEIRDPERNIPRALFFGIAIVIACYVGANLVYVHVLGRDALAASTAVATDTMTHLVGPVGAMLITLAAMLSILGFMTVALLVHPRIYFAMARDGAFFEAAAKVHPKYGSPHVAILILGAWSIALLIVSRGDVGELVSGVVFADWIFFGLGAASLFALRIRRPLAERPYRAFGYPLVPGFFVAAAAAAVVSAIVSHPRSSTFGAALLVAGAVVYIVAQKQGIWRKPVAP